MDRRLMIQLLGGAVTARLFASGRELHARTALTREWGLKVLDPHQNETVTTIAELIIPATDTPGARAAKVNEFIDLALGEWFDADEKTRFLDGLADIDARSRKLFAKDFTAATSEQQTQILKGLDLELAALRDAEKAGVAGEATTSQQFFRMMRRLTLLGYFTSEAGATQELHNPIIPGRYDGCVLLEREGN